jgi:2-dehydro-3-deoxyphosphogluconate aldolase/(4S)-4-hydroxy-2-oxoglutarate aldolase
MTAVLEELTRHGVVPVLTVPEADRADDLGAALVDGGLPVAEVTLRTAGALEVIGALAERGDLLVGAGTVTSVAQADAAITAGARFVVCPGLGAEVVTHCMGKGITVLPGVATATEVQAAVRLGLSAVKLFPAEIVGGRALVEALAAPFPDVRFVPTGGIKLQSIPDYVACPAVLAVGGSWLATRELLADKDWKRIADNCRRAVATVATTRAVAGR